MPTAPRRAAAWLLAAAVLLAAACADTSSGRVRTTSPAAPDEIDVEFGRGSRLPTIECSGPWKAVDGQGREQASGPSLAEGTAIAISRSEVVVGGIDCGPPPVALVPERGASVGVAGRSYRGCLRLELDKGSPRLLNRVRIEDYLLGVVPGEMPERFGLEALKAQAVAARSYAIAEDAASGRVYADTRSQMYAGREGESALASRAVKETKGEVLTANGRVVQAFYCSTCGGRTAPADSVFDGIPAGVMDRAVTCPDCRSSPSFAWVRRFPADRVCTAAGLPAAKLERVTVAPATVPARVTTVTVQAGGLEATVSAADFRSRLSAGRAKDDQLLSTQLSAPPRIEEGELVLEGRGWGHGVGLCQYGAAGFAARGATYSAILARYYPGTELTRRDLSSTP